MRAVKAATMTGLDVPAELIAPLRPCCNKFHQVRPCCKNKAMVSFLFIVKYNNEVEPLMALSKVHGAQVWSLVEIIHILFPYEAHLHQGKRQPRVAQMAKKYRIFRDQCFSHYFYLIHQENA